MDSARWYLERRTARIPNEWLRSGCRPLERPGCKEQPGPPATTAPAARLLKIVKAYRAAAKKP